ncbi:MAG: hypothetical protein KatS3mg103_0633 [Phycisphaerales bacterium]|nr:MAG: hypothetical protein KatS3mg103_0633 [Phycisphaerales bacterium]
MVATLACQASGRGDDGVADGVALVRPVAETQPVPSDDDAADDPAIWRHPTEPSASLIVGTDKKRGLGVYRLDGSLVAFHEVGPQNNVDLRADVVLAPGYRAMTLVASSDRDENTFRLFELSPAGELVEVGHRPIETQLDGAYGLCMYHSAATGQAFVFINDKAGRVEQWRLLPAGEPLRPRVDAALVRAFYVGGQTEGMAADDRLGWLYVGEERTGCGATTPSLGPCLRTTPMPRASASASRWTSCRPTAGCRPTSRGSTWPARLRPRAC